MKRINRILFCLLLAIVGQVVFAGCHTAHGFGEDVESAGQAIQNHTPDNSQ